MRTFDPAGRAVKCTHTQIRPECASGRWYSQSAPVLGHKPDPAATQHRQSVGCGEKFIRTADTHDTCEFHPPAGAVEKSAEASFIATLGGALEGR